MVHRIHNRNIGYSKNSGQTLATSQPAFTSTGGATALDMGVSLEQNKIVEEKNETNIPAFENISIENATYLQNVENNPINEKEEEIPNFEVESIELANPKLFSEDEEINSLNKESVNERASETLENSNFEKDSEVKTEEPELFENSDSEDNFEIPAFLRRQKN